MDGSKAAAAAVTTGGDSGSGSRNGRWDVEDGYFQAKVAMDVMDRWRKGVAVIILRMPEGKGREGGDVMGGLQVRASEAEHGPTPIVKWLWV